jgi:anthranilate/para-aminobenzoate synthase component I
MSRIYDAFRATRGPCVLLESTAAPSPHSRRSLLARNPRAALAADQDGLRQATADGARRVGGDAFTALRSMLRDVRPGEWPDEGGVAGALSYDAARPGRGAATPKLIALAVDRFVVEEDGGVLGDGGDGGGLPLYAALRRISPAPFAGTCGPAASRSCPRRRSGC